MTRDWKRLGLAIKRRREELGMTTQQALADAAGVTRQSVQSLESGKPRSRTPKSLRAVEEALGWEPGTAARFLAAEEPSGENGATVRFADGMPARVVQELASGEVYDTEIIELSTPGSPWKLVAVFKQDTPVEDMDPKERRKALEEWSRAQRALRGITSDQNGSPDQR